MESARGSTKGEKRHRGAVHGGTRLERPREAERGRERKGGSVVQGESESEAKAVLSLPVLYRRLPVSISARRARLRESVHMKEASKRRAAEGARGSGQGERARHTCKVEGQPFRHFPTAFRSPRLLPSPFSRTAMVSARAAEGQWRAVSTVAVSHRERERRREGRTGELTFPFFNHTHSPFSLSSPSPSSLFALPFSSLPRRRRTPTRAPSPKRAATSALTTSPSGSETPSRVRLLLFFSLLSSLLSSLLLSLRPAGCSVRLLHCLPISRCSSLPSSPRGGEETAFFQPPLSSNAAPFLLFLSTLLLLALSLLRLPLHAVPLCAAAAAAAALPCRRGAQGAEDRACRAVCTERH